MPHPKSNKVKVSELEVDQSDTKDYLNVGVPDLNLYFMGTFLRIGIPEECDPEWHYVSGFSANDDVTKDPEKITVTLYPAKHNAKKIHAILADLDIDFSFPQVGLYNYKDSAIFFMRRNWRQNKKGLCEDTTHCLPVTNFFTPFVSLPISFGLRNIWRWTAANVEKVFSQAEYMDLSDAFKRIKKYKCLAKALNLNFLLGQGLATKDPSLWFRKTLIGSVLSPTTIQINNPLFLQEAIDFFQPQGVTVQNGTQAGA